GKDNGFIREITSEHSFYQSNILTNSNNGHFFQIGDEPHKNDKVVGELLQKRSAKYSTRVPSHYIFQILTRRKGYVGSPYNERYRKVNPIMHSVLGQRSVKENSDLLDDEFRKLMQNLCQASTKSKYGFYPKYVFQHTALNIKSLMFKQTEFENLMGIHLKLAQAINRLSEFFPILKRFPNTKLHNAMIESADCMEVFLRKLVKEVIDDKEKKPCIIRELLRKKDEGILDDLDVIYLTDTIFAAGIIGQSCIPKVSDEQNIPYIRAIIKEGQRYCAALYLGVPHAIEEDDEYNRYHIPANFVVISNQYGIHTDEKRYEIPNNLNLRDF
ncbi:6743_t:CDS:2, partial [Gigaspora margarita]